MKAIIFDCDGTLVDSEMSHYTAWAYALKKYGVAFTVEEYSHYVGQPIDKTSLQLADKMGKNCARELQEDKHSYYQSLIKKTVSPIQDTFAFLLKLVDEQKNFGYKLAIASGAPREEIALYLKHLNIGHHFDVVVSGRDDLNHYNDPEGVNKPKPYIYLEAAKLLGISPKECIGIEDSSIGVTASARAGLWTIAIPTVFSQHHDFSSANLVLQTFKGYSIAQFLTDAKKHNE